MLGYFLLTFGSLFAIVDPFAAIPAFLAMTEKLSYQDKRHTAKIACMVCWLILTGFALLGSEIFSLFGITLPAFQVAGGLIVLLSALDMLRAKRSPLQETAEETQEGMSKDDIAITPLAVPMLAGPGAITTAIVLSDHAHGWVSRGILYLTIAGVAVLSYLILTFSSAGAKRLSSTMLNIITRLMGLMLAAIGVQFILTALKIR